MAIRAAPTAKRPARPVHYRESDGKPIAETPEHLECIVGIRHGLRTQFAADPLVYIGVDQFLYYVEGEPRRVVCPDVFVVRGVPRPAPAPPVYKLWEGRVPNVVIEVTSRSTRSVDLNSKRALYERLGVREYILFDPLREYLEPRLRGFRLVAGGYRPTVENADGRLVSEELGLELAGRGHLLRLYDAQADRWLPLPDEEVALREAAEVERDMEAEARRVAEAGRAAEAEARRVAEDEIARLRAELGRRRSSDQG